MFKSRLRGFGDRHSKVRATSPHHTARGADSARMLTVQGHMRLRTGHPTTGHVVFYRIRRETAIQRVLTEVDGDTARDKPRPSQQAHKL